MVEWLLGVGYLAAAAAFAAVARHVERRTSARSAVAAAWRGAAEACDVTDLQWTAPRLGQDSAPRGRWGAHAVRFELSPLDGSAATRVVVGRPADVAADISLRQALGAYLPADTGAALLARALRAGRTSLAEVCLASLGRGGALESVATLAEVLGGPQPMLSAAAARALGRMKRVEAEGPLLRALRHASAAVRLAAAGSLAEAGTPAAVVSLKELAEREAGAIRTAARNAVAEIQARLTGASPGQVSLSAGDAGHVSLSDHQGGRVSLEPDRTRGDDDQGHRS
jgi:hypothetical protein